MAKSVVFVDQLERITSVNHCPEVVSALRNAFITGQFFDLPFADNKLRPYELPGFKAISSCEDVFSESDFDWVANFIKIALESSEQEAWSLTSFYLFGKSHKWEILKSQQILELLCTRPLLRSLIAGTFYTSAPRLLEAVANNIEIGQIENQEDIKVDICLRGREWFCDYVIDYFDDNFEYEHSLDACIRHGPCDDEEEWDNLFRNETEKQLKSEFDETTLKECFVDYLGTDIAGILLGENYYEEMDDAIDNYIWILDIPDQESIFKPYSKPVQPSDEAHEYLIVEKLFNDYRLGQSTD